MGYNGTDVLSALQSWWQYTPAAVALTPGNPLWFKESPEGALLPYATFFLVSDVVEIQTTSYAMKRASIQVNFHHSTDSGARALAEAFRVVVRQAPLSINASPVMHVLPDGDGLDIGEGLGPDGDDCYIAFQTIDCPYTQ